MTSNTKTDPSTAAETPGLRDLFAAHALSALISSPKLAGVPRADMDGMAKQAYDYANAMIAARSR
jgi:hypothetical protein